MRGRKPDYVRSPLLDFDQEGAELDELGRRTVEDLLQGDSSWDVVDPNQEKYEFKDSRENKVPDWWRPRVQAVLQVEDETVRDWMNEAISDMEERHYRIVRTGEVDPLTERPPQHRLFFNDREQIAGGVTVEGEGIDKTLYSVEKADELLEENVQERDMDPGNGITYDTQVSGFDAVVEPDLSAGVFKAHIDVNGSTHSSEVWMPYADREEALLISPPSQFNEDIDSSVVSVPGDSYTGDTVTDAVADSLGYFLPFLGIPQSHMDGDAVEFRSSNGLDNSAYDIKIQETAWDGYDELDCEYRSRVIEELDKVAMRPNRKFMAKEQRGYIDQVGEESVFILYDRDESTHTVELKDVGNRKQIFHQAGNNRRT